MNCNNGYKNSLLILQHNLALNWQNYVTLLSEYAFKNMVNEEELKIKTPTPNRIFHFY